ncbi:MAG TPA: efflux RND transporter periplasmic adaptor subunit [Gemmatimonadaceae bacterium]|nr:efflux RND transporter periplasmic adaptor subunit [Gemmatimonadaceae bacterium]
MSSMGARGALSGARWAMAIVSLMAVAACGGTSGDEAEAAPAATAEQQRSVLAPEDVAVAARSDLAAGVVLTGSLQPYKVVRVKSQVSGTVRGVRVDRGTPVRRGQVMATIEAAGVRTQAEAARANLALAKQKLEAARTLHEAGAMSAIDFRTAQAAYEAAQAQAAQAEEAEARSTIRAPITGVVSERSVDGGEAVGIDAPLFTVVNSDTLELSGQIPVDRAAHVRVGAPVAFTLTASPDRELSGRVARIDPVADPGTRQVGVYVQLANSKHTIIGGQFATGRIVGEKVENAVVIPELAVRGEGDSTYVLTVSNGRVAKQPVTVGPNDRATGRVAIAKGLEGGEKVIVTPSVQLAPGTQVVLATDEAAAPRETARRASGGS